MWDSVGYYLRQLHTYNLAMAINCTLEGHMYVWNEAEEPGKGSDEPASCRLEDIDSTPLLVKHLVA